MQADRKPYVAEKKGGKVQRDSRPWEIGAKQRSDRESAGKVTAGERFVFPVLLFQKRGNACARCLIGAGLGDRAAQNSDQDQTPRGERQRFYPTAYAAEIYGGQRDQEGVYQYERHRQKGVGKEQKGFCLGVLFIKRRLSFVNFFILVSHTISIA